MRLDLNLPKEAADNMLKQPHSLLLDELRNHVAQDSAHGVKSLIGCADVRKTNVIKKDFLHDEDRYRLAQLGTSFHDAEAERDDFGSKEEIDHIRRVILDKSTNNAQRGEAQIFERARLRSRVEKRIKEKRNMSFFHQSVSSLITKRKDGKDHIPLRKRVRVSL